MAVRSRPRHSVLIPLPGPRPASSDSLQPPPPVPFSSLRPNQIPFTPPRSSPAASAPVPDPSQTNWTSQVAALGLCPHGPSGACPGTEPMGAPAKLNCDGSGSGTPGRCALDSSSSSRSPPCAPPKVRLPPKPSPAGRPPAPHEPRFPTIFRAASATHPAN